MPTSHSPPPFNPTPTQQSYTILCPMLWLEAELRRNSERSGLGGPSTRFAKSHEDIFWEEFEKLLECGTDYAGRNCTDFKTLTGEQLKPLILECFHRSNSGFRMRLEDPRWNLGKSKDQIVDQILEGLISLREEEAAGLQPHVAGELKGKKEVVDEMEMEEDVAAGISPNSSESPAMVILDAHFCRTGCELDRDLFKQDYGVSYETALLFQNNSDLVAAMSHYARLTRKRRPAVLTNREFSEAYEELVKWGVENVGEGAEDVGLGVEILETFRAVMGTVAN